MKQIFTIALMGCSLLLSTSLHAQQDKSKRPSPPATVTQVLDNGATISIHYSQPSLKGRTIGQDIEPMKDKVWRMGANEATIFETDRDIKVEGKELPKGKYSIFGLWSDEGFTLIFNKATGIWGTQYAANKDKDALRVTVQPETRQDSREQLSYVIDKSGLVTLLWGTMAVNFTVQ